LQGKKDRTVKLREQTPRLRGINGPEDQSKSINAAFYSWPRNWLIETADVHETCVCMEDGHHRRKLIDRACG
jgi:hypothetical protein